MDYKDNKTKEVKVHDLTENEFSPVELVYDDFLMTTKNDSKRVKTEEKYAPLTKKSCRRNLLPLFNAFKFDVNEQLTQNGVIKEESSKNEKENDSAAVPSDPDVLKSKNAARNTTTTA